ncbi:SWIM zinc finger family protein [Alkalibacillus sp. S2W]|uniref:SWIM zinc finger family protein n=1 Tax=Alkalibacillus sp. S2W TaxID=3386553 RepID=UPI00398C8AE2
MIHLNDFEKRIERVLVNRGFDLFQDGAVTSLERQSQNVCASVEESTFYQVKLKNEKGVITNAVCTCPLDHDDWCRHQVAVMFQLLDRDKEKSITELLKSASKEQLVDLLLSLTSSHENLESHIRLYLSEGSKDHMIWARRLVSEALEDADYGGFIPWHKTFDATLGASYVLEQAEEAWRDKDIIKTVDLTFVVIEELVDYIDETDDSSGLFGSEIDQAIRLLNKVVRQAIIYLDREDYLVIIDQVIEATQHERFREWPKWSVEMLRGVMIYGVMSEVREKIEAALQHIASSREGLNRDVIIFEYDMKWELGDTDLNSFLNQYLDIPDIRERLRKQKVRETVIG